MFFVFIFYKKETRIFFRSTVVDSCGLNSTECTGFDASDASDFWGGNDDRHRGRLPSQLSSSGIGAGPIKNINTIFVSKDE